MAEMMGQVVPAAGAHFLTASVAPVGACARATSAPEVLRRLLLPRSRLASQPQAGAAAALGRQLGALAILQASRTLERVCSSLNGYNMQTGGVYNCGDDSIQSTRVIACF